MGKDDTMHPLFKKFVAAFTQEERAHLKSLLKGYGGSEILAWYRGPHGTPLVPKINEFIDGRGIAHRVRFIVVQGSEGRNTIVYIRGVLTEEEAHYILTQLHSRQFTGDMIEVAIDKPRQQQGREPKKWWQFWKRAEPSAQASITSSSGSSRRRRTRKPGAHVCIARYCPECRQDHCECAPCSKGD